MKRHALRGEVVDGATNELEGMSGDVVEKVRGELEEPNLNAQDKDKVEVGGQSSRGRDRHIFRASTCNDRAAVRYRSGAPV